MMSSRTLFTFISLYISLCVMVVAYFLYSSHDSHPYSVVAIALPPLPPVSGPYERLQQSSHPLQQEYVEKSYDNNDVMIHKETQMEMLTHKERNQEMDISTQERKDDVSVIHVLPANSPHPPMPRSLPYTKYVKKADDLHGVLWITQLHQHLKSIDRSISPHVNMVLGDSNHMDLVMNWIIAARVRLNPPLHNIMVVSIDQKLCDLLVSKKVPVTCIVILPQTFLLATGPESYQQGIKTRLLVLRLMNFWGYDVASYDSDAVILRNPQHFYDSNPDVQIFAGSVRHPPDVVAHWGFTVCAGTLIVRSHPSTENLWKAIHRSNRDECEQSTWNHAMLDLGVMWNVTTNVSNLCSMQTGWQSHGSLASIVFPQHIFCRKCCDSKSAKHYYLVHLNAKHSLLSLKRRRLQLMNSWFLRANWRDEVNSSKVGDSWLRSISSM